MKRTDWANVFRGPRIAVYVTLLATAMAWVTVPAMEQWALSRAVTAMADANQPQIETVEDRTVVFLSGRSAE